MRKSVDGEITIERIKAAEEQIVEQSKRIEFYLTEYSVELLAMKMQNKEFEVPAYQREFTWEPERKSRFIESLLMGLPIPFLFFWESPETGKLEIVDGSQRLRTIEEFILGDLRLDKLEELPLVNGFRFSDLPLARQRKIRNRSIRGIILGEHADEEARFDLFERINTGSKIANRAEVRRGALQGAFQELVIELAKDPLFVKLAPASPKQVLEREREELLTRFFAYGDGLEDYRQLVFRFLFSYTKKMNDRFETRPKEVDSYRRRFFDTMEFVDRNFPNGFRKTANATTTPRARFESIAVGSYLAIKERPALLKKKIKVDSWLDGEEFSAVTGADGANHTSRLKARIDFVRERLLGTVR